MYSIKTIAAFLFLGLVITFAIENREDVTLRYYFGLESSPIPLSLLILASVFLGVLIASAFTVVDQLRLRREIRKKDSALQNLSRELQTWRRPDAGDLGSGPEEQEMGVEDRESER